MTRTAIVGNAGGGKSTLARLIAATFDTPLIEIDTLYWREGWVEAPRDIYDCHHAAAIAETSWVIDGLGRLDLIPQRLSRATEIILIDMPLWTHFWLAAERQISWVKGCIEHTPGGLSEMPPTKALFQAIWEVDQSFMPQIRVWCSEAEQQGKSVIRLGSVEEINAFSARMSGA